MNDFHFFCSLYSRLLVLTKAYSKCGTRSSLTCNRIWSRSLLELIFLNFSANLYKQAPYISQSQHNVQTNYTKIITLMPCLFYKRDYIFCLSILFILTTLTESSLFLQACFCKHFTTTSLHFHKSLRGYLQQMHSGLSGPSYKTQHFQCCNPSSHYQYNIEIFSFSPQVPLSKVLLLRF